MADIINGNSSCNKKLYYFCKYCCTKHVSYFFASYLLYLLGVLYYIIPVVIRSVLSYEQCTHMGHSAVCKQSADSCIIFVKNTQLTFLSMQCPFINQLANKQLMYSLNNKAFLIVSCLIVCCALLTWPMYRYVNKQLTMHDFRGTLCILILYYFSSLQTVSFLRSCCFFFEA